MAHLGRSEMGFKKLGLFLLVLLLRLHAVLLHVHAHLLQNTFSALDQKQGPANKEMRRNLAMTPRLERVRPVDRHGGFSAAHGGGINGVGGGRGTNGGKGQGNGEGGATVVHLAFPHSQNHHYGSRNRGTIKCVGPTHLVLAILATIFLQFLA